MNGSLILTDDISHGGDEERFHAYGRHPRRAGCCM